MRNKDLDDQPVVNYFYIFNIFFFIQRKHTKLMNKESMLFRTHEIKSKILKKSQNDATLSLFFFIKDDNFQKFKEVLEKKKINLEEIDEEGNTLLNVAVQCNSFNIANYLINTGANVNTQNVRIIILSFY